MQVGYILFVHLLCSLFCLLFTGATHCREHSVLRCVHQARLVVPDGNKSCNGRRLHKLSQETELPHGFFSIRS
jgi:hypothetical protein